MSSNRTLVALLFALLLMVPSLGCTGYGALLHIRSGLLSAPHTPTPTTKLLIWECPAETPLIQVDG